MVSVNCAALTETLLESELFGHVRGAFTGAVADKVGLLELASEGTLFLDEIGEMPLSVQAKLLRVLENGEMRRVGSTRMISIHPRILAATHRDLQTLAEQGEFRQDLYFRLNSFVIELPALHERRNSIPPMVQSFMRQISASFGKEIEAITPDAMAKLMTYRWPGNVRELKHAIERSVVVARGKVIDLADLPPEVIRATKGGGALSPEQNAPLNLKEGERKIILQALALHGGNRMATAAALKIDVSTLWRKMRRYELL
jgi:transcriptional regulator with PAS, ATPase and Fis domain